MCMKQMIIRLMIAALAISLWVSCDQEKTIMYQQEAGVRFMYQAADEYSFVDNYGRRYICIISRLRQREILLIMNERCRLPWLKMIRIT